MRSAVQNTRSLSTIVEHEVSSAASAAGVDLGFLHELAFHGFSQDEIFEYVVPRRTLARRRQSGERLSLEESDRAVRLARITALAERVFSDPATAYAWLREPSRTLAGAVPLKLLRTETGAHLIEQTLHRIDYGMLA